MSLDRAKLAAELPEAVIEALAAVGVRSNRGTGADCLDVEAGHVSSQRC